MTINLKGLGGFTAWSRIERQYQRGEPVTRDQIHEALDSGDPIPVELNPMLREIVTRGYRTTQGRAKSEEVEDALELEKLHGFVSHMVDEISACIKDTSKIKDHWGHNLKYEIQNHARQHRAKRRRAAGNDQSEAPIVRARKIVGQMFGLSHSKIRDITKNK